MTVTSKVLHRNLRTALPRAVMAQGCYIQDDSGRRYFDASSSQMVSSLGHGNPDIVQAIAAQLARVEFIHSSQFTTDAAEALASELTAGTGHAGVHFVSGGSEGVEAAVKLARQYHVETGQAARYKILSRAQSYHGGTLGALSASGTLPRRQPFLPMLSGTARLSPCYPYRGKAGGESERAYGERLVAEFERLLLEEGPETVAALMVEPVAGAVLGAAPPVPGYLAGLRRVCDQYGVLLIFDEVMCGMWRTGSRYAHTADEVEGDIVIVGKGLAAGYAPIGAVLACGRIVEALRAGSGGFVHGHTFMAHPVSCAAALAVQQQIVQQGLDVRVAANGLWLKQLLAATLSEHPHVGDIRGRGLFHAIEFVQDRASAAPLPAASAFHDRLRAGLLDEGIACYVGTGTIDGSQGHHLVLAPPFIATRGELERVVATIGTVSRRLAQQVIQ